jgi:hypothetical protein
MIPELCASNCCNLAKGRGEVFLDEQTNEFTASLREISATERSGEL